jgi:murein tripeptide amidase MpaA
LITVCPCSLLSTAQSNGVVRFTNVDTFDTGQYYTYADQVAYLQALAVRLPNLVTLFDVGNSFQSRKIYGVKISRGASAGDARRRGVFIDGGIHAREWIAHAAVLHVLHTLAFGPTGTDTALSALVDWMLDKADWCAPAPVTLYQPHVYRYIVPNVNPDGYEYTWTQRRYWRKNRGGDYCWWPMQTCCGADLNRNFPFKWGGACVRGGANTDTHALCSVRLINRNLQGRLPRRVTTVRARSESAGRHRASVT